ncbi:Ig-like domain-containing protein [Haloplanus halophilus]|uniref:Ig-like domain-containing protein n=1 Tax=Haloplanus halophilus TaxID=2949993 RepID=UPI00204095E7|nr:Ig-like domain-containing protein [Haloplanus sp. GDY1]
MRLRDDRRAAALQVGAILLLGFLVIGLALYQATVVPDQNEEVEFDHSQQVQESLQQLRNGILQTASAERTSPTTIQLGTRYPTRIVAVNPPPSSGRLATEPGGEVRLVNATAINDETADYWNGTTRSRSTRTLTYDPDYSLYQAAPRTVYDDTVLYNDFGSRSRAVTDQRLLQGNLIYVVALDGDLSRSGTQATSVSPTPVSASDRTVAVNGSDIAIEVTTDLPEDEWERLLADQYESNGGRIDGNASGVTVTGGTLTVDLVPNRTYRLRMAKIGVGTGVSDTSEQYLTVVDGADSVTAGGTRRIVLEVRDGYNNPVSGVTVDAAVSGTGADILPSEGVSDGSGQVIFEYGAPNSIVGATRTDSINFTFDPPADRADFSGEEPESVRINVTVVSLGSGNGGGGSTPPPDSPYYPDAFNDGNGGDGSIPPENNAYGYLSDFANMQEPDSQTAKLETEYRNPGKEHQFDVGTVTRNVAPSNSYTLEIAYFFENGNTDGVDVVVVDEGNQELDRFSLDETQTRSNTGLAEDSFTLNQAATDYISNNGDLYVRYETTSPSKGDYVLIEIGYQRLRAG